MPNHLYPKILPNLRSHIHFGESPALYVSHTIRTFSLSLIGIFIPIFIFNLENKPILFGQSVIISSIMWVLLFYIVRTVSLALLTPLCTHLIFDKLSFKLSIFSSTILLALTMALLSVSANDIHWLVIAGIVFALQSILYWVPYHLLFIRKASSDGHFGKKFGIRLFFVRIASALGPFIGAIIIVQLGFLHLFVLGTLLISLSALPVLFSIHEHKHARHNAIFVFKKYFTSKKYLPETIAFTASSIDDIVYSIFWPIVLLITLESFTKVGSISSISLVISSILAIQTGRLIDKHGAKNIHKIGLFLNSLLYIPRLFPLTSISAYTIDILDRLNGSLYGIPLNSQMYEHARLGKHDSDYIIYREIVNNLAMATVLVFLFILVPFLPNLRLVFIVPIFIAPLSYFINFSFKDKNDNDNR